MLSCIGFGVSSSLSLTKIYFRLLYLSSSFFSICLVALALAQLPIKCHKNLLQIGVLIEDKEPVNSYMGGKPWKAGKFSLSLRMSLWSEHLGLRTGEVDESNYLHSFQFMVNKYALIFGNLADLGSFYFFSQNDQITDPIVDSTYKDIWMATAKVRRSHWKNV